MASFEEFNAGRAARGRAPIRPSTFAALEEVGVYAKDIEGWIAGSAAVRAAKMVIASEVKDYWKSIAPVRGDKPTHDSKEPTAYGTNSEADYKNSIKIMETDSEVKVGSELFPLCDWLEYGSIHNPEHGYGARVLAHFGGGPVDAEARVSDKLFVG